MPENSEFNFGDLDSILNDFEKSTNSNELFSQIDQLCEIVDQGFDNRREEIIQWPEDRKRKEAADSQDPFVLNLLSVDENFNVRALAACNRFTPVASLRRLVEASDNYMKLVIANNPSCPSDILDRIIELTEEPEVVDAVQLHPNVSAVTKFKIVGKRSETPLKPNYDDVYVSP